MQLLIYSHGNISIITAIIRTDNTAGFATTPRPGESSGHKTLVRHRLQSEVTDRRKECILIDRVVVLRPTRHKIGHFEDVS